MTTSVVKGLYNKSERRLFAASHTTELAETVTKRA
jgi:hypothetical protein